MWTPEEIETRIIQNERQIVNLINMQDKMAKNALDFCKAVQQLTVELGKKGVI